VEELKAELADILKPTKRDRRFLISLLQELQERLGYLPEDAMLTLADFLGVPGSTVYGVATFYNQFRFLPLGKHQVKVCMGTACHLAGGQLVLEAMSRELQLDVGGVTSDRIFSLERVACVGCCALAPVVMINGTVYPRMSPLKVEEVLVNIKSSNREQKAG